MTMETPRSLETVDAGRTAAYPTAAAGQGYYGRPLLKPPVWTWEIPTYFFVGGAAGAAAVIAEAARRSPRGAPLARDARWLAAAGGALSAPLLIADLGRPERFFNMLRVLKPQSPMSAGVYIVMAFSTASAAATAAHEAGRRSDAVIWHGLETASGTAAALFGLGMATYTGVLLGATAVPVWRTHVRLLPLHFAASGLGAAVSLLELRGHTSRSLRRLGFAAAAAEALVAGHLETRTDRASAPLKHRRSGWLMRAAGVLSGPLPLVLRAVGRRAPGALRAASLAMVAGSLLTRYAWIAAGRASASDPREPLSLPDRR